MTDTSEWFVPLASGPRSRVFMFPHAGAGCAQLAGFARLLGEHGLEVNAASLPGRQARLDEPARTTFLPLVRELADALAGLLDEREYLLLGYCGGALLAYGVSLELAAAAVRPPGRLVVVSYEAADIAIRPRRLHKLSSAALWSRLRNTGGIPAGSDVDPRLRQVAEPAVRADFAVLADYRHEHGRRIPVPITACFGARDADIPRGALLGWRRQTSEDVRLHALDGGKWLLDESAAELAALVAEDAIG